MALVSGFFFFSLSLSLDPHPRPIFFLSVPCFHIMSYSSISSYHRGVKCPAGRSLCVSLPEPPVSLPACFLACRFTSYTTEPWAQEGGLSPNFQALLLCLLSISCKLLSVRWVTFCNLCCQIWLGSVEKDWRECRMDELQRASLVAV